MTVTNSDRMEQMQDALQDLREDAALLQFVLLGAQPSIEPQAFSCLLRLSDYLKQHIQDAGMLFESRGKG